VAPVADAFEAVPLGLRDWGLVAIVSLLPAVVAEVVRTGRRGRWVA